MTNPRATRRRRGMTLVETLIAVTISATTLIGGVAIYINGMMSWARGSGAIDSLNSSQNAVRLVGIELREATKVTITSAGKKLTYQLPVKDSNGDYTLPLQSDTTERSFELIGSSLRHTVGNQVRIVASDILTNDPESGQPYKLFESDGATTARRVIVQIAASKPGYQDNWQPTRARETISLRNIPQLTR